MVPRGGEGRVVAASFEGFITGLSGIIRKIEDEDFRDGLTCFGDNFSLKCESHASVRFIGFRISVRADPRLFKGSPDVIRTRPW